MRAKLTRRFCSKVTSAGVLAAILGSLVAPDAFGSVSSEVVPRAKPTHRPSTTRLSESDYRLFSEAFAAANRGQWGRASQLAGKGANQTAQKLMQWYRLTKRSHLTPVTEIFDFVEKNPGWPRESTLLRTAEDKLRTTQGISDQQIVDWFSNREPLRGEGKISLGEALIALGRNSDGEAWVKRGWIEHDYSAKREQEILKRHAKILSAEINERRLHRQLWSRSYRSAKRSLARVSGDLKKLADARIKLMTRAPDAKTAVAQVSGVYQNDVGLLFDQVRWHRRSKRPEEAWKLLMRAPTDADSLVRPEKWWIERKILARKALEEGEYDVAYAITRHHGLTSGADFADAEWLAGWIALRYLDKPKVALKHFQTLYVGVNYPVSKARAAYWAGRAAHANDQIEEARRYYLAAASYPTTFYGQLAATATARGDNHLRLTDDGQRLELKLSRPAQELMDAVHILYELGENRLVETFVFHLNRKSKDPQILGAVANLSQDLGYLNLGVRAAKSAARYNVQLIEASYPLIGLPVQAGKAGRVEDALLLGLSRQESEFKERAVSRAGALGLMQLMPSTAKITARVHKLPYARHLLLDDPTLNLRVGSAHLSDLVDKFDGSYILAIAAYNAGAHRVRQWIAKYGDPRDGTTDPVDWIELIPFSETRNYVQRVLENTQIYRNRLAGRDMPLMIAADLARYRLRPRSLYAPHKPVIVSVVSKEPTSLAADPVSAQWSTTTEEDTVAPKFALDSYQAESQPNEQPETQLSEVGSVIPSGNTIQADTGKSGTAKVASLQVSDPSGTSTTALKQPEEETAKSRSPTATGDADQDSETALVPRVAGSQPAVVASIDSEPEASRDRRGMPAISSSSITSQTEPRSCRNFVPDNSGGGTCADYQEIEPLVATVGPAAPEGLLGTVPATKVSPLGAVGVRATTGAPGTADSASQGRPATYLLTNPPAEMDAKIGELLPPSAENATYRLDQIELRGTDHSLPTDPCAGPARSSDGLPCEVSPSAP